MVVELLSTLNQISHQPEFRKLPIHNIMAIKAIETIKPIVASDYLETVKRLCQRLNDIMIYAGNTGLLDANPLSGISKVL